MNYSLNTTAGSGLSREILAEVNVFHSIGIVITLSGSFLNALEIASFAKISERRSPFNMTLLSLAIADLVVSLVGCCALMLTVIHDNVIKIQKNIKLLIDIALATGIFLSLATSILHVIFITIHRALSVLRPLQCKRILTRRRCIVCVVAIWIISAVYGINYTFLTAEEIEQIFGILTLVCTGVLFLSYSIIYHLLRTRVSFFSNRRAARQRRSVLLHSVCVTAIFVMCTLPRALQIFKIYPMNIPYIRFIPRLLLISNSVGDPLIYFLFKKYRHATRTNMCWCCRERNTVNEVQNSQSQTDTKL